MSRLLLIVLLLIPLLLVMFVRDPHAMGHFIVLVFTVGARMLSATADFLNSLISGL